MHLYNSLGRELQEFRPVTPGTVRLYTCGLTVYNYAHLGNLRAYIFTDTLRRALQLSGYDVLHVMNITDVGHLTSDADEGADKMEAAALRSGRSVWDIADYYTRDFQSNLARLNVIPPSAWTKATDHIQEMIAFARRCEARGYTYELEDGLYFDTSKVRDYGRLALLDLQGQVEGARVALKGRRNPADFAVWRRSPTDAQRLMEWRSPWGVGAPGWHLECSVMSLKYLGAPFDIHTGGVDHRQIHHVNEIAQNQAYLGDDEVGANYWLHNEFLLMEEEKMSKSKGDFVRLQTLVDWGVPPLSYRYFVLMAHYRSQLRFSRDALLSAHAGFARLVRTVDALRRRAGDLSWARILDELKFSKGGPFDYAIRSITEPLSGAARRWIDSLNESLRRDLNTPQALAGLAAMLEEPSLSADERLRLVGVYDLALGLSLLSLNPADLSLRPRDAALTEDDVRDLIAERKALRAAGDFRGADAIRDRLAENGVVIRDTGAGTEWDWVLR